MYNCHLCIYVLLAAGGEVDEGDMVTAGLMVETAAGGMVHLDSTETEQLRYFVLLSGILTITLFDKHICARKCA